jgi:hypothetical protein
MVKLDYVGIVVAEKRVLWSDVEANDTRSQERFDPPSFFVPIDVCLDPRYQFALDTLAFNRRNENSSPIIR